MLDGGEGVPLGSLGLDPAADVLAVDDELGVPVRQCAASGTVGAGEVEAALPQHVPGGVDVLECLPSLRFSP